MSSRPQALADITQLLIRAQSGEGRAVLAEIDSLLTHAEDEHANDRAQWLRYVRFAARHDLREFDDAAEVAGEITRLAEPFDDQVWLAFGYALQATTKLLRGQVEPGYDDLARAVVGLEDLEHPRYTLGNALNATSIALARLDLYELAIAWLERLHEVADELADPMLQTLFAFNGGWLHLIWAFELDLVGQAEDAARHYRDTLAAFASAPAGVDDVEESSWPDEVVLQSCAARVMLGEGDSVLAELERAMDSVLRTERHEAMLIGHLALARGHANVGNLNTALDRAEKACEIGDGLPRVQVLVSRAYWEYADLLHRQQANAESPPPFERLARRLIRERWDERRARVLAFEERVNAERVRDEQRRRAAAYLSDPLTGVGNRRLVEIRLPELLVDAEAMRRSLVVVFIDLDNLKSVNDEISHLAGDDLLRELAQELRAALSADDVLARFGGDEFVIVLPDRTAKEAFEVVDELRHRIQIRSWNCLPGERRVEMSAGLAESWASATRTQLLAAADEALLRAKREGKNRVEVRAHPLPGAL